MQRKYIGAAAAIVGLLGLSTACYAAFAIFQTYTPPVDPRVQKNLVSDYGGVCDALVATRVVTITNSGSGLRDVAVTASTFASGDVGKTIAIPGAGSGGNVYTGLIAAFVDDQHITLGSNASVALSASSRELIYGTDNQSALVAFKTAFQGTTPVQLNLPGNCGYAPVGGGFGKFPLAGIADVIVAGNGVATSGIYSFGGNALLGGEGQYQDSSHSLRTNTANAGDSCVIVKTQPSVTVSNVTGSLPFASTFTASASGTTLTVTTAPSSPILPGMIIGNSTSNPGFFNAIQPYGTAGTTGVGGTGTYALSTSATFSSQATNTAPVVFTATVDAHGLMSVSSIVNGTLTVGAAVFSADGAIGGTGGLTTAITTIKSQLTGSAGGVGDYQLDNSQINAIVSPTTFQLQGLIRATLNSTAGLSTGDTIHISGVIGQGQLPQRANGLKWVKVIDGTTIELFQWVFDGGYTSGGSGGGDRTSLMPTGSKVMMTGWVNQAYWAATYGFPSNPHWFEYKTVTSTNSGTHQICFDSPLVNTYKDTWPQYNTGSQFEVDTGGPATLYVLSPTWETTIEFKSLTLYVPSGQTYTNGRNITWRDVAMVGGNCAIPTQNETHTWINVSGPNCNIETDKIVGTWTISGTSSVKKVDVQSSSMDTINIDGLTAEGWFGSPKNLIALNINVQTFRTGTLYYGVADETSCTDCTVTTEFGYAGQIVRVDDPKKPWSMSGGVITIPNAYSRSGCCLYSEIQTQSLVPGHYAFFLGAGGGGTVPQLGRAFKVVDVTQDVDNTYIQTNEAGGFPTGAWTTNGLSIQPHPAPKLTVVNAAGADTALAFNGCPAQAPIYTCQNFIFTGNASGSTFTYYSPRLWGELDTFTFTNNVPYTNTGALGFTLSRFANWQVLKTDLTTASFGVTASSGGQINTTLPSSGGGGTRTLTPSGATGTQSLDSLTATAAGALFGGSGQPNFSANTPSDSPQVTVTLRTNQQLP
jgi:hypothetical protein